ncbi:MAG TPA: prenyltransferase/squalene oxidase repeat-containing protein [Solirubrobacterales bacterium]|jgi:hypothetical protein
MSHRLALAAVALIALLAPATAAAKATPTEINTAKTKGVEYLKGLQKTNGEIPGFGGDWALTAFAAAGVAPADVKKTGDARGWYEGLVGSPTWPGAEPLATDFERGALLAYAAGIDPARVSKRQNLIAKVASYYQPESPGYYGSTFNATVFGLLALADVKTPGGAVRVPPVVLEQAEAAVKANQHTDGGWTWEKAAGNPEALGKASEPDMTGAAIAALCTAGVPNTDTAVVNARKYLASKLNKTTGAIESPFGVNTDTTAWAVQGLKACAIDPQEGEFEATKTPLDFLISQQVKGGGFRYGTTGTTAEQYAGQDAVRALGSGGFTAAPPKPSKGEQWNAVTEFATGATESTSLALIVDNGSSPLKICSVTLAPEATTATLAQVLTAAVAGTTPASCVTGFLPGSGEGAITQVNGFPASPAEKWNVTVDGGTKAQAKRSTVIHVGDTIYLKYE